MSLRFQKCRRDPSVSLVSAFPQSCTWEAQKSCEGQSQKSWKSKHKRLEKGVLEKSYTWQSLTNIVRRNQKSCQTTFKDILWIDYKCLAILFVSNKLKGFTCSEPSASLSGLQPDKRKQLITWRYLLCTRVSAVASFSHSKTTWFSV